MSARGRFVVLLGPDGCGKSSVLAGVARALAGDFAGVQARHDRPQAPWGAGAPVDRPHARPPRSLPASVFVSVIARRKFERRTVRVRASSDTSPHCKP